MKLPDAVRRAELIARHALENHDANAWHLVRVAIARRDMWKRSIQPITTPTKEQPNQ